MRRGLAIAALLLAWSTQCTAQQVNSVSQAWTYLSQPGKRERWVIISSKVNQGYFQCGNMDTFVGCPMPVWIKRLPEDIGTYDNTNSRGTPHPEVAGSYMKRILTDAQVAAAKNTLRALKLQPDDVYSQIRNEKRRIVGTAYEVRIALEFDFKQFEKLVEAYMQSTWKTSIRDGYEYITD